MQYNVPLLIDPRVFTISAQGFKSAWTRAMANYRESGGERFAENDLRAMVATQARDQGMDATFNVATFQ
ncbi:MAG: hypothetical protein G3I10_08285 [Ferrovum sp.]|nr:hypothetical protein [Ferrovum sp.]